MLLQSNTLRISPRRTLLCPLFFTYTYTHIYPHANITHPLIQTQGNTPLFQQPSALCHAPYEHAWQHFAHAVIANYFNPGRRGQSQEDVPECACLGLVFDQDSTRTIDTKRSLTETTATSPATANRSVTAAEKRRPLYVPNTKNNRNSTRP